MLETKLRIVITGTCSAIRGVAALTSTVISLWGFLRYFFIILAKKNFNVLKQTKLFSIIISSYYPTFRSSSIGLQLEHNEFW